MTGILEVAERKASEIEAEARKRAEQIVSDARAEAEERIEQAQAGVLGLVEQAAQLSDGVGALGKDIGARAAKQVGIGAEVSPGPVEVPEPTVPGPEVVPSPAIVPEPSPPAEPEPMPEPIREPTPDPLPDEPDEAASAENGDSPGADETAARLVAMKMALDGTAREEIDAALAEKFEVADRAKLLDDVLERAGK